MALSETQTRRKPHDQGSGSHYNTWCPAISSTQRWGLTSDFPPSPQIGAWLFQCKAVAGCWWLHLLPEGFSRSFRSGHVFLVAAAQVCIRRTSSRLPVGFSPRHEDAHWTHSQSFNSLTLSLHSAVQESLSAALYLPDNQVDFPPVWFPISTSRVPITTSTICYSRSTQLL